MSIFSFLHPPGPRSQMWISNFPRSKSFAKRWARHIYTFIWETVSDWFIWHLRSFNFLAKNVTSWYNTTHGAIWALAVRQSCWKNQRHYLTWETGETGDHNCNAQWLQVGGAPATLRRSPAVAMYTWTGERYDRSRLAFRVSALHGQAKLLVYARGQCERVSWFFLLFWYF